ncbi:MAG: long-chain-fatty-acid--CoA ligase [Candidatus Rokubacteria bacterium]|nr:long-chain-fatty-acid--CoA ligase [Candidatus Rokubacteria bacterium]
MNLGELITRNARRTPETTAVVFGDVRLTYREFNERVNRLSNALFGLGLRQGDRFAILADNCHQYLEANGAAAKTGIGIAPLNIRFKGRELTEVIESVEPTLLIFGPRYRDLVEAHRSEWKSVVHYVDLHGASPVGRPYEDLLRGGSATEPAVEVPETALFSILFTSGTTGLPKGIMLSHRNLLINCVNVMHAYGVDERSINLNFLPMFFSASINCTIWPHLYAGATNVILEKFSPQVVLGTIQAERATYMEVVPTMIISLLQFPDIRKYDLSSLKTVVYGSAPMPVNRLREAIEVFGDVFAQIYGLTEATCVSTVLRKDEHLVGEDEKKIRRLASCGREGLNVHLRVVREDGTDCEAGEVGELIIRGDHVMLGYWRSPEATAQAIRNGWLHSGDLVTRDEDGYVYIVDRKKDIIISGGINISSKEVEDIVYMHPAVLEAAVIGVPDEKWGESVRVVVALKEGVKASEQEIVDFCAQHLAGYKKPRSVMFIDALPRNPTGKVQKLALREKYGRL